MKNFFKKILNIFFPENTTCNLCGAELTHNLNSEICDNCDANVLPKITGKICLSCGEPIYDMGSFCLKCKTKQPNFTMARAAFVYNNVTSKLVKGLKVSGKKYMAKTLAYYMAQTYIANKMMADVITYVPISKKRKKQRGFNQSCLLAEELSKNLNIPISHSLIKSKETEHQTGGTFQQRQQNIVNSFSVENNAEYKNKTVLLIDDVYTTGATVKECTKVLLKQGKAKSVLVLTACHTTLQP